MSRARELLRQCTEGAFYSFALGVAYALPWALAVLVLLGLSTAGCAAAPRATEYGHLPWTPGEMVIVLDAAAPECLWHATVDALDYLRPSTPVQVAWGAVDAAPERGHVLVRWEPPGDRLLGLSTIDHRGFAPHAAVVRVQQCRMRLMAHELAHVLGLRDVEEPGRLMTAHFSYGAWTLTAHELEILRPPSSGAE